MNQGTRETGIIGHGAQMHLDAETAVTVIMAAAIAGIGPACIGLMLLL